MYRTEVWFANLPVHKNSCVQSGSRPVLILSGKSVSSVVTVLPMTLQLKKLKLPTHVIVNFCGSESLVLVEQIMTIDKIRLVNYMGVLDSEDMARVDIAVKKYLLEE